MKIRDYYLSKRNQKKSITKNDKLFESSIKNIARGVHGTDLDRIKTFNLGEMYDIHITPVHFYQPIPDTRNIKEEVYNHVKNFSGINFREKEQLALIEKFSKYANELKSFPHDHTGNESQFYFNNEFFGQMDSIIYYSMIREFNPKRIIEVGSGFSTMIASQASSKNSDTLITSIEPYPNSVLTKGLPNLEELIKKPVQEVSLEKFKELEKNDILFIDSSHVVHIGSDVNYLFLEVIPELKKGTMIHIHDWFYPFEYPKSWINDRKIFWNEMYLVQAFLTGNSDYDILTSNYYLNTTHFDKLKKSFPFMRDTYGGSGSLWIRKNE
ncbi:MAG: class I SAM-dependent methyltransferase [Nitrosopumilus sp.]|nr:class I SAM-dependent methyltransferase [Nitrosopumilus sp.]